MNKYHAKQVKNCEHCGFTHSSQAEAAYCERLHLLMRAHGDGIVHVDVHPVVTLPGGIHWRLDFCCWSIITLS